MRRYQASRLTVVTVEETRPILRAVADRVLCVRMRPVPATALALVRVAAVLHQSRIDLALDFEQYVRASQVLLYLARPRQMIAFDTRGLDRAALADVKVPYDDTRHTAESFLDLARAAGVRLDAYTPGGLAVDPAAADSVARWCTEKLVILHPGSGDNFPGRRWPTRKFGLVARRLVDEANVSVAVTGTRREHDLVRQVVEASERPLLDLCGALTLEQLIALIARSSLLISNDTGPVHLASALDVPVLGLYGPNTPLLYGPLSTGSLAFYEPLPCSPCITNFNYKTSRCRNPVCIRAIDVDEVAEEALRRVRAAARTA